MKKSLLLVLSLLFVLFSVVTLSAQDWRKVTTQSYKGISGIFFINSTTGWAAGMDGLIYKSTDAGNTWIEKYDGIDTIDLMEVFFLNENTGYVGGKFGNIFKTTDGGETWSNFIVTGATSDVKAIYMLSETQSWVLANVGSGTKVFYTSDGGTIWTEVFSTAQPANDMHFSGGTNGIVVGKNNAELFYTTDGISWLTSAQAPLGGFTYTRSDIRGVYMVSSTVAYAVGWGSLIGLQPSIHIKTTDGGATWTFLTQTEQNRTYENLYSVYFKDADNGVAVGGGGRGSVAVRTNDGGANWIPINFPCGATISTITGVGDNLWVCGSGGLMMRSTDFGNSWDVLTQVPGATLYSIQYLPDNSIVAAGFDAIFLKSTNSGIDWRGKYINANNVSPNAQCIYFVNENIGFAGHSYGLLTKTTNGGDSWFSVIPDTISAGSTHYGIFFLNENYGFSVGKLATNFDMIYKTTDGGATWDLKTNIIAGTFRSVAFADENNGIVVGEKLKSIYTTDGGSTWNPSTFVTLPPGTAEPHLRKVKFRDNVNAVATGDGLILNSTDAGATWNYAPVTNLVESITGISFKDSQTGWAVGTKSASPRKVGLYKTTDGGLNWVDLVDTLIFPGVETVYDVSTHGEFVWICGSPSNIFTDEPLSGLTPEDVLPASISLSQNYPNPFNPSTKISFELTEGTIVSVKVYDVLGREVKTLFNEYKPAGVHELVFSGDGLSSGVYFYVLRSKENTISKKMTLLK